MRLFIAIDLPEELKNTIADIQRGFRPADFDLAPVPPENLHLTLMFLGEVGEDNLPGVEGTIQAITKNTAPFRIDIERIGYFTSPSYIRVIWVGIDDKGNVLLPLVTALHTSLNYIRKEPLKPHPHLTLFRVRSGKNRERLLQEIGALSEVKVGRFMVDKIVLKQSRLARPSPVYSDVKAFPLGKSP